VSLSDADRAAVRTAFADDAPAREARIRQALGELQTSSDTSAALESLGFEAHSIVGAAASARLEDLAALAAELEQSVAQRGAQSGSLEAVVAAAERLLERMEAVGSGAAPIEADPGPRGHGPIVLHVEDNLSNLKLVERILARRPEIELNDARTGAEALRLAPTLRPSLILLDLRLPDMAGEDVLRRLRADPATRQTPVVVVSAEARPAEADRLLAAGADDFLVKPIDVAAFLDVVDRMVARAQP
jgi:CheY-like chemotaxis protein